MNGWWANGPSSRRRLRWSPGLGTAAVACAIDYTVTPHRLTPGFELRLSRPAMAVGYVALGLGIAAATLVRARRREDVAAPLWPAG